MKKKSPTFQRQMSLPEYRKPPRRCKTSLEQQGNLKYVKNAESDEALQRVLSSGNSTPTLTPVIQQRKVSLPTMAENIQVLHIVNITIWFFILTLKY